jgi:SWI/SNF-related matrix-associated actin-dependent regulator 1 of chromatin subfamily A
MQRRKRIYDPDAVIELLSSDEEENSVSSSSGEGESTAPKKLKNKPNSNLINEKEKENNAKTKKLFLKRLNKFSVKKDKGQQTLDFLKNKHTTKDKNINNNIPQRQSSRIAASTIKSRKNLVVDSDLDSDSDISSDEVLNKKNTRMKQTVKVDNHDHEADDSESSNDNSSVIEIDGHSEGEEKSENSFTENEQNEQENNDSDDDDAGDDDEEEDEEDEEANHDETIQVPDSSPHKNTKSRYSTNLDSSPPAKITTKLPSLRQKFSFDPKELKLQKSNISSDYVELKRSFPDLPASTIIAALKSQKTIRNAMRHLKTLSSSKLNLGVERASSRLDSLNSKHDNLLLSSSPINKDHEALNIKNAKSERDKRLQEKARILEERKRKQAESERILAKKKADEENIVSSKVQMDFSKKSLTGRYVTERLSKRKPVIYNEEEEGEGGDEEDEEEEEEEEDSLVELVDSDDESVEEIPIAPTRRSTKRRYEDNDDDYAPGKLRKPKLEKKTNKDNNRKKTDRSAIDVEDEDSMLPEFEVDEDAGLDINQKIIKLFNNAEARDIIDLSNMKPEQVELLISKRPYRSMKDIFNLDLTMGKNLARSGKTPIERFVEVTGQKLAAYSAIDTLLRQCYDYSKSITNEIKKWGINLKGKKLDGELDITNVNVESEDEVSESESAADSDSESISDAPILKKKYKRFKIDGSENDDDFSNSSKKKLYKSNIDNSKVKDRIGYFKKKPSLLSADITLKDYQQVGINWLNLLFQKQLSCILADEMGLGKTAQVIAFLSHLKKKKYAGPHLIVVPSSTLENWLREFEKFSPSLKIIPYYGSLDEREELRHVLYEDDDYDVIVTTYNLTMGKLDAPFLQSLNFNTIVYDEGHMLKNATSDRYKKLTKLRTNFRLLLTGTPLQNNLKELISLLDFILPEIFDSKLPKLELLFDQKATTKTEKDKIAGENYNPLMSEQAINKARVMMSPFVLRRTKAQVMKDLPKKHTTIEYCELVPSQLKIYQEELKIVEEIRAEKARRKLMKESEIKKLPPITGKNTNILMTLRKACLHPLLFRRLYTDPMLKIMSKMIMKNSSYAEANQQFIYEDMQVMTDFELTQLCHAFPNELGKFVLKQNIYEESGKVKKLVEMLIQIINRGEKVLIFSLFTQVLDILEKVLSLHNWKFLRLDGGTMVETRQSIIDKFYEDKTIPIMLLSTKAGGFGINLVCATNVIIYDQSLNPHDDRQAEDRAHRVGQTKEVHVTRLIVKDTIEENILHMAFNKLQLDNSMMSQNVEDVLLKTVEDLIATKRKRKNQTEDHVATNTIENEVSTFEAFETPLSLELVAENDDEPVEITKSEVKEPEDSKRKRRRQRVNYYDGPSAPVEFFESDNEVDDKYNKNEMKDELFIPTEETAIEESNITDLTAVTTKDSKEEKETSNVSTAALVPILPSSGPVQASAIDNFFHVRQANQVTKSVEYIDNYLKEINNVTENVENDPMKSKLFHQAAEKKIKKLHDKIRSDLLKNLNNAKILGKETLEVDQAATPIEKESISPSFSLSGNSTLNGVQSTFVPNLSILSKDTESVITENVDPTVVPKSKLTAITIDSNIDANVENAPNGSRKNETAQNGKAHDGKIEDGKTQGGKAQYGKAQDEKAPDGKAQDKSLKIENVHDTPLLDEKLPKNLAITSLTDSVTASNNYAT